MKENEEKLLKGEEILKDDAFNIHQIQILW